MVNFHRKRDAIAVDNGLDIEVSRAYENDRLEPLRSAEPLKRRLEHRATGKRRRQRPLDTKTVASGIDGHEGRDPRLGLIRPGDGAGDQLAGRGPDFDGFATEQPLGPVELIEHFVGCILDPDDVLQVAIQLRPLSLQGIQALGQLEPPVGANPLEAAELVEVAEYRKGIEEPIDLVAVPRDLAEVAFHLCRILLVGTHQADQRRGSARGCLEDRDLPTD